MTPDDLAALHPRFYHITHPDALDGIRRHGLLSTSRLLDLFEVPEPRRSEIERRRRPPGVRITHPVHGAADITDNLPLSEKALAPRLDDGLTPADWLMMLNARVFFWPDRDHVANHLAARFNRGKERLVLVLDTATLASAHGERIELAPINTGATLRGGARRGLATFTPLGAHPYRVWRKVRGQTDAIKEVTVLGGLGDVTPYLIETRVARISADGRVDW